MSFHHLITRTASPHPPLMGCSSARIVCPGELLAFYVGSAALSVHVVTFTGCIHQFSSSCKPLAKVLSVLTQEADVYPEANVVLPGEVGLEVK